MTRLTTAVEALITSGGCTPEETNRRRDDRNHRPVGALLEGRPVGQPAGRTNGTRRLDKTVQPFINSVDGPERNETSVGTLARGARRTRVSARKTIPSAPKTIPGGRLFGARAVGDSRLIRRTPCQSCPQDGESCLEERLPIFPTPRPCRSGRRVWSLCPRSTTTAQSFRSCDKEALT